MSLSSYHDFKPTVIATCENHKDGNGRQCSYGVDSEYYSTNTLESVVKTTQGSHPTTT